MCRGCEVESKLVGKSVENDVGWCFEIVYCVTGCFGEVCQKTPNSVLVVVNCLTLKCDILWIGSG